jgi:hypothetical protein
MSPSNSNHVAPLVSCAQYLSLNSRLLFLELCEKDFDRLLKQDRATRQDRPFHDSQTMFDIVAFVLWL